MKTTLYVITNISMPNLCKIGITNDLGRRLNDLNKTGVPTRFQIYQSFDLENAEILEQEVLSHFAEKRLNKNREFIEEHPERVCEFIRENKNKVKIEIESKSKFDKAGIPEGADLYFFYGDIYKDIKAKVLKNGKIFFEGKETSLSAAAQKVLDKRFGKKWKAVQGTIFWVFNGKLVKDYFENI
jgi:hypothetical protein